MKYNVKRCVSSIFYVYERVPILNSKGEIMNLVTQSALVGCLANNLNEFKESFSKTVKDLNLINQQPVIVQDYKRALDALAMITEEPVRNTVYVFNRLRIVK